MNIQSRQALELLIEEASKLTKEQQQSLVGFLESEWHEEDINVRRMEASIIEFNKFP